MCVAFSLSRFCIQTENNSVINAFPVRCDNNYNRSSGSSSSYAVNSQQLFLDSCRPIVSHARAQTVH